MTFPADELTLTTGDHQSSPVKSVPYEVGGSHGLLGFNDHRLTLNI